MAEAFALVGLASSIVAFVDFSLKIIAAAKSVRDSGHKTLPRVHEIGVVLEDVRLSNLRVIQAVVQGGSLSEAERHIMAMATECDRLERELRGVVEKLKINGASRSRTIQSARLALRMYRKEKEIEELHRRILSLDARIRSNLQMILDRRSSSETLSKLSALKRSQEELGIKYNSKLDRIQENILQLFESEQARDGQLVALKKHLDSLVQESAVCQKQYRVIKSLYFPELLRRWSDITNADKFTNDWLFDSTKTNFLAWLKDGKGIYWISGKAGSGKSTLIKFAAKHDRTAAALKEWAGSAQLHTASFYFWNQGYEMQKSQVGLLQSLLYQILKQAPELAQLLCSDARLDHERWELNDLKKAFESIAAQSGLSTKYCFFIDGLDEFHGDEETVLSFLSYFSDSKLADIKICVSSRPRALFKSFEQSVNSLIVQHYTEKDMRTHVRAELQMNGKFNNLPKAGCEEIIAEISQQSQGVWLWVYLVTRDLVHAVNRDEGFDTLREIVRQFPPDLEAYFEHVIKRVKHVHRVEMAQIFLITTEQAQPLPLFLFSLIGTENCDSDYAMKAPIRPLDDEEVSKTEEQWKARIQNRCGDLLVLKQVYRSSTLGRVSRIAVDFLHRTVRDFLRDCYYSQLKEIVAPRPYFDPLLSLCRMMLFLLKSVDDKAGIIEITHQLLYYAHEIEKRSAELATAPSPIAELLDELIGVNNKHAVGIFYGATGYSWEAQYFEEDSFLALAIEARLVRYVRAKLAAGPRPPQKQGRPLLDTALRPINKLFHLNGGPRMVDVDIVRLLLEHNENPNQSSDIFGRRTVWVLFLTSCVAGLKSHELTAAVRESWYQASALLCLYGADPQAQFEDDDSLTVESVLEKLFGSDQTRQLQKLMAEYRTRQLKESMAEHHEPIAEHHEPISEHQEPMAENQEPMDLTNRGSWFPSLNIKRWLW